MFNNNSQFNELKKILDKHKKEIERFSKKLTMYNNKANKVIATFIQQAQSCGVPPEETRSEQEIITLKKYHREFSLLFNTTQILIGKVEILILPPTDYLKDTSINLYINNEKNSIIFLKNEVYIHQNSSLNDKKTNPIHLNTDTIIDLFFKKHLPSG